MVTLVGVVSVTIGVPGALGKAAKREENGTPQRLIFAWEIHRKIFTLALSTV